MATTKQIEPTVVTPGNPQGPRSAAGRLTSSLNAYKPALTGQLLLMASEQAEALAAAQPPESTGLNPENGFVFSNAGVAEAASSCRLSHAFAAPPSSPHQAASPQ